jgi:hypothetical protein
MPSGFELEEEDSGPIELTEEDRLWGKVDAYENWYTDAGRLFSGTPVVANIVEVYSTPQYARGYIQAIEQVAPDIPDFKGFRSVPTIGDETIAFEAENNEGLFPMTGYFIFFRKGNLLSWIATGGITGIVEFDDAIWFAQESLNRINEQIGCCNAEELKVSENLFTQESKENRILWELVKELLESQGHGQWESLH